MPLHEPSICTGTRVMPSSIASIRSKIAASLWKLAFFLGASSSQMLVVPWDQLRLVFHVIVNILYRSSNETLSTPGLAKLTLIQYSPFGVNIWLGCHQQSLVSLPLRMQKVRIGIVPTPEVTEVSMPKNKGLNLVRFMHTKLHL